MSETTWLESQTPMIQTLCGTLFTWGLTALGASLIYILPLKSKLTNNLLDCSLGFAAGVMLAASYWSLLSPALDKTEEDTIGKLSKSGNFDEDTDEIPFGSKLMIVAPVAIGFLLGAAFVSIAGKYSEQFSIVDIITENDKPKSEESENDSEPKLKPDSYSSCCVKMRLTFLLLTIHSLSYRCNVFFLLL